jgi:hypothetical protein
MPESVAIDDVFSAISIFDFLALSTTMVSGVTSRRQCFRSQDALIRFHPAAR